MTVKELIECNQMIIDIVITVRKDGSLLLDQISIGNDVGNKPPYPMRVPIKPEYAGSPNRFNENYFKDAAYIRKSINAREDGKEYWETKWKRIPAKYLDLEVYDWDVSSAYRGIWDNNFREGEKIHITALPSGEKPAPVEKPVIHNQEPTVDDMQITIDEYLKGIEHG